MSPGHDEGARPGQDSPPSNTTTAHATPEVLVVASGGRLLAVLGPDISEDLSPEAREGLARRRLVALGQPCPCGATLVMPTRRQRRAATRARRVLHVEVAHEPGCPATCAELGTTR